VLRAEGMKQEYAGYAGLLCRWLDLYWFN